MNLLDEPVEIALFQDEDTAAFRRLNLEWLETHSLLEPEDLKYLDDPQQMILAPGGKIFVARCGQAVVGTCALVKETEDTAELAKFAVDTAYRKRGIGRMLALESIKKAAQMGFKRIVLVSNHNLASAVRLYETLGFIHKPLPESIVYETADVYMELEIV